MKKSLVFWSLQEGKKETSGMKSIKRLIIFHEVLQTRPPKNGLVANFDLIPSWCNSLSSNT